ncbi:sulfate transporter [Piscirickettsia salmonis]|uniref:NTP binding protein (Contains STAS domain) n=2 Tax=Piscirickettsia salmonis TaxID=1238 RepID=A0A9Q5YM60_PISSA|nr:STAS domain-containing protein [Piscirickettsia salmonis]RNC78595.1 STAS domain-containing protein [Piscirickettsiaceae bacterium NZ-RLO2]ALA24125.1 STAS domain protein [Piscirickettsia salmonis]APS44525.1 sulfate transporter [Piscirickettsia salmonis]APS47886.1 sulfate transporter [Piscirickettsia salmonis]APS51843.1 sulfate transporter [Piscirickettsia salmonis]
MVMQQQCFDQAEHQAELAKSESTIGFALKGEVSFKTVNGLWQQSLVLFADMSGEAGDDLQVDLAQVTLLDSAGLALLVAWKKWAQARQWAVCYRAAPTSVKTLAVVNRVSLILAL